MGAYAGAALATAVCPPGGLMLAGCIALSVAGSQLGSMLYNAYADMTYNRPANHASGGNQSTSYSFERNIPDSYIAYSGGRDPFTGEGIGFAYRMTKM